MGTSLAVGFMFDSADGRVSRVTPVRRRRRSGWTTWRMRSAPHPAIHLLLAAAVMVYRPESWWLAVAVYGWVTSGQFMVILAEQFVRAAGRKRTRGGLCVRSSCCPPARASCALDVYAVGPRRAFGALHFPGCGRRRALVDVAASPLLRPARPGCRGEAGGTGFSVILPRVTLRARLRAVASTLAAMPTDSELVVGNDSSSGFDGRRSHPRRVARSILACVSKTYRLARPHAADGSTPIRAWLAAWTPTTCP